VKLNDSGRAIIEFRWVLLLIPVLLAFKFHLFKPLFDMKGYFDVLNNFICNIFPYLECDGENVLLTFIKVQKLYLLVGLISVITDIVWKATVSWYAGNAACKIIRFLQVTVTYSSTYVLVALSIDRYDAITHPMNFSGSWRRARLLVVTAWMLSLIFSIPILIMNNEQEINGRLQCWIHFPEQWHWQLYIVLVAVTIFMIPALIITACYTVIVFTIWSKSKLLVPSTRKPRHMKNGDHVAVEDQDSRRASSRGLIPKAKIKTVKMTFVIVFVFILCWSPYIVFDLLQVFGYISETQTNIAVATFIQSLAPLNSAANPLIYCLFSTHICRSL
ncbi:hypothetical protein L9F63_001677, partial [Diploptera punctata]